MTKRHFKALAKELYAIRPNEGHWINQDKTAQWLADCQAVASVCRKYNEKFSFIKFIDACEGR